ncbi:MAG TPA: Crp/Fnr family transcriptional regulator [Candidatus Acidoferrales bacterium]|nr:Crp/Fnr family transcriptional regulator [Candidatus Acidoferrales bacterium]
MRPEVIDAARYQMLRSLAGDPAFADVPATVLQTLVEQAQVSEARRGRVIYEAGETWGRLGFVVDGCIAMAAIGDDGKEHQYELIFGGQFFGVSAIFDGGAEMARTVVVSENLRYASIQREHVLAAARTYGTLAIAFAVTLAHRVRRTTALLAEQVNLTARERIARYLLQFAVDDEMSEAREPLRLLTLTQIGAAAGTVKDVASRTITALEQAGALRRERGNVRWLDASVLRRFARTER